MNRLVIIGNGFDIAHGLKTSYMDFINWYWEQRVDGFVGNSCREKMPIVRKRICLETYAVIGFGSKVTNSSPLTRKIASNRLYFNYLKERFIHFYGTVVKTYIKVYHKKLTSSFYSKRAQNRFLLFL